MNNFLTQELFISFSGGPLLHVVSYLVTHSVSCLWCSELFGGACTMVLLLLYCKAGTSFRHCWDESNILQAIVFFFLFQPWLHDAIIGLDMALDGQEIWGRCSLKQLVLVWWTNSQTLWCLM